MQNIDQVTRSFAIQRSLSIRPEDLNEGKMVHHWVYLRWLESLRHLLLRQCWENDAIASQQVSSVLTSTQIEYRQPAKRPKSFIGRMWLAELGRTHWTVKAEIHCDRVLAAIATQTGFQMDQISNQPILVPEELATAYWEFQWNLPSL